jgi:hypothetical protein
MESELLAERIISAGLRLIGCIRYGTIFLNNVKSSFYWTTSYIVYRIPKQWCWPCLWNSAFAPWHFLLPSLSDQPDDLPCIHPRLVPPGRRIKHALPKNIIRTPNTGTMNEPHLVCAGKQFVIFFATFLVILAFVIFPNVSRRLWCSLGGIHKKHVPDRFC